jgi:GT2 family glycosyltransferase
VPLVSVVVPTHNRPDMLSEALASVRAQTFTDYEIVVVSDGEGPEMRGRSRAIAALHDADWCASSAGNVSAARNFGVTQAVGDWIAFLDDDDVWLPEKLDRQMADAGRTGADMISCDWVLVSLDGEKPQQHRLLPGQSHTSALSAYTWFAQPSCVVVKKAVFEAAGGFDRRQKYSEEMDLWRRISWRHTIHQTEATLVRYRHGHLSLTSDRYIGRMSFYELRHLVKMHFDTPRSMRHTLPSWLPLALPRLGYALVPPGLRAWLRPRRRLLALRRSLS